MGIYQLAIFWRDQAARAFSSLHFTAPNQPSAQRWAQQLVALFDQLSDLQIYGAVLDHAQLAIAPGKPAPPQGTQHRLEINLYPDAPLAPNHGITLINFSILGPKQDFAAQPTSHPDWPRLEQALFPFICLRLGHKIKPGTDAIKRIELVTLDEDKRPQPANPPIDAAIVATERKVAAAQAQVTRLRSKGEEPTPKEMVRVTRWQAHLAWLQQLQHIEEELFTADAPTLTPALAATIKIALGQSTVAHQEIDMPPIDEDSTDQTNTLLPAQPKEDDLRWQDVPLDHFAAPGWWLHREALRQTFNISERSYYRWINTLKAHGLQRSLPSQKGQVTLFYRADIEQAIKQADGAVVRKRTRRQQQATPSPSQPLLPPMVDSTVEVSQGLTNNIAQLETTIANNARLFEQQLAALQHSLLAISQQQLALVEALATLTAKSEQFFAALPNQTAQAQTFSQAFELLAQFAPAQKLVTQLNTAIRKLNTHANNKVKAKTKSKVSPKAKPKAKAKLKAKASKAKKSPAKAR